MKNKITHDYKGFSQTLILCAFVLCTILALAGYRVNKAINEPKIILTTEIKSKEEVNNENPADEESNENTTQVPTTPVAPPITNSSQAPVSAPKSTPTTFTTSITIKGDSDCQSTTLDALKLLSDKAPAHYLVVTSNIGIIECASQGSGMFAYENPPRFLVGDATRTAGAIWYAGTIVHDAGHSKLYHDYLSSNPGQSAPDSIWTGEAAERTCLEAQYDVLSMIGGTQTQLDYVKNIINSEYYNVPYDQRWW